MKKSKTIIPIAVVALFLCLALAPTVSADELDQELEIGFTDKNGYTFYKKIIVTPDQLSQFNDNFTIWENKVTEFALDNRMDANEILTFIEITNSLVNEIKELTYDSETGMYNFPEPLITKEAILQFIEYHLLINNNGPTNPVPLPIRLHLRRIFTIGRGRAWLPIQDSGETFIGARFLPIMLSNEIENILRDKSISSSFLDLCPTCRKFNYAEKIKIMHGFIGKEKRNSEIISYIRS